MRGLVTQTTPFAAAVVGSTSTTLVTSSAQRQLLGDRSLAFLLPTSIDDLDAMRSTFGDVRCSFGGESSDDPVLGATSSLVGSAGARNRPEPQFDSLARLLAWAVRQHGLTVESISSHRDHASTACPGQDLYERVKSRELGRRVQAHLAVGPVERRLLCGAEAGHRIDAIQAGA